MQQGMAPPSNSVRRKENFVQWKETSTLASTISKSTGSTTPLGTPAKKRSVNAPTVPMTSITQGPIRNDAEHVGVSGVWSGRDGIARSHLHVVSERTDCVSPIAVPTKFVTPHATAVPTSPAMHRRRPVSKINGSRQGSMSSDGPSLMKSLSSKDQLLRNGQRQVGHMHERESNSENVDPDRVDSFYVVGRDRTTRNAGLQIGRGSPKRSTKRMTSTSVPGVSGLSTREGRKDVNQEQRKRRSGSRGGAAVQRGSQTLAASSGSFYNSEEDAHAEELSTPEIAVDEVSEGEDHTMNFPDGEMEAVHREEHSRGEEEGRFAFYNEGNDDISGDSEEDDEIEIPLEEPENTLGNDNAIVEGGALLTETEKRRERRQELAARKREGDRRRAEGLPRNYLLVDEYTNEPYGQGVGSWRKEVMLLSKKLDPAIGNINRQPDDAVKEIGEWIQHTWEYSRPIKWEFVKEVIARGVTLRRHDLWKKIRLNQSKPNDVSDRSWRSLQRKVESHAMMNKFQNCSKANASRQNFGRTGPSGEVGVRERLRKRLRRSPSPTEIRQEMARPKGFSGRSKRHEKTDNVMHGSGNREVLVAAVNEGSQKQVSSGDISLSEEQVLKHPIFVQMMQRLEALEKRGDGVEVGVSDVQGKIDAVPTACVQLDDSEAQEEGVPKEDEVAVAQFVRKSGRPRKKTKL